MSWGIFLVACGSFYAGMIVTAIFVMAKNSDEDSN